MVLSMGRFLSIASDVKKNPLLSAEFFVITKDFVKTLIKIIQII